MNDQKQVLCKNCGRALVPDEIAITKKLINRGATEFMCIPCIAKWFDVTEGDIQERITCFKQMGCTLFEKTDCM